MNLIHETLAILKDHQKDVTEVKWVGSEDGTLAVTWPEFAALAADSDYENPSGAAQVAVDLVVVGEDWWLERHDCRGAEWWEFKALPLRRETARSFTTVLGGAWDSLAQLGGQARDEDSALDSA